jgi:hypothetical protein
MASGVDDAVTGSFLGGSRVDVAQLSGWSVAGAVRPRNEMRDEAKEIVPSVAGPAYGADA